MNAQHSKAIHNDVIWSVGADILTRAIYAQAPREAVNRLPSTDLLRRDVERYCTQIHLDELVRTRNNEEQTCESDYNTEGVVRNEDWQHVCANDSINTAIIVYINSPQTMVYTIWIMLTICIFNQTQFNQIGTYTRYIINNTNL